MSPFVSCFYHIEAKLARLFPNPTRTTHCCKIKPPETREEINIVPCAMKQKKEINRKLKDIKIKKRIEKAL